MAEGSPAGTDVVIDVTPSPSSEQQPVQAASAQQAPSSMQVSFPSTSTPVWMSSQKLSSPQGTEQSQPKPPPDHPFIYPEYPPTQEAIDGDILYDFNIGVRVQAKEGVTKRYHLIILDNDTDNVLFDGELKPGVGIGCSKKFYISYKITICDEESHVVLWEHVFDMHGKDVFIQMPWRGAVGDSIAWFSVLERFQMQYGAKLHVLMPPFMQAIFEKQYPDFIFETYEGAKELRPYACFYLGLYFHGDVDWQPHDFRMYGLAETCAHILGLKDTSDIPPRVDLTGPRTIPDRYVCIATQASSHAKHWCNPHGWRLLVKYLKDKGYRVLCIDKEPEMGCGDVWHYMPHGCEDFTGDRPLQERIDMIRHADFFIGLNSGLSWLAWCCRVPVVVISGICMEFGEFRTPYRVLTRHTCHGCWNDQRCEFDHSDFMWCPRLKGTPRAYECTKSITPKMVINMIETIPNTLCSK